MAGKTPERSLDIEILFKVVRPKNLARLCLQAEKVAFCAEGIDLASTHQRSNSRAGRITNRVRAIILVFPNQFAVGFTETEHPFSAVDDPPRKRIGGIIRTLRKLAVCYIHASFGNHRPGITRPNLPSP